MQKKREFKGKQQFKDWTILKQISGGGNGDVWVCQKNGSEKRAIKLLKKSRSIAVQRFKDEVETLLKNKDVEGVIEIIDYNLPNDAINEVPFYVMPLGKPLSSFLVNSTLKEKIKLVLSIAKTLEKLHERGICHRDIKPSNIIVLDDIPYLIDFGLVTFNHKAEITREKEQIGPRWTIAPEIIRQDEETNLDYFKADIYSLAKTLWIILTGKKVGFEGQYSENSSLSLNRLFPKKYLTPINRLIEQGTDNEPKNRQTISEFINTLVEWEKIIASFSLQNKAEWKEFQEKLFPLSMPQRVEWDKNEEIISVLNILGKTASLNHTFAPSGGGRDITRASQSIESGCIEIYFGNECNIIKPKRLIFECFKEEVEWNYFRLETADLYPSKVSKDNHGEYYEIVCELKSGQYREIDYLEKHDNRTTKEARQIVRHFKGSFVIFCKSSFYNSINEVYDARHEKMNTNTFRKYIEFMMNTKKHKQSK